MDDKDKLKSGTIIGSVTVGGGFTALDYKKEIEKFKNVEKVNSKRIDHFYNKLKPGDILLESDPKDRYTGKLFAGYEPKDIQAFLKAETKISINEKNAQRLLKNLSGIKFNDTIQLGGGGSRYHHAAIYLGDGKVAEMVGSGPSIVDLRDTYTGKRIISLRVSEDLKVGKKISQTAKDILKEGPTYRETKNLFKDAILKNMTFVKSGFDGNITCTEFVKESIEGGTGKSYINTFRANPADILTNKDFKVAASYNFGAASKKEKILNFIGKNFSNGKFYVLGAGLGAATVLGLYLYNKYKQKEGGQVLPEQQDVGEQSGLSKFVPFINEKAKSGTWITYHGKRIFIRNKKK